MSDGHDGGRLLAVASTGGHLVQLRQLVPRLRPRFAAVEWVTFDTPQSRDFLAGETVHFVHATITRDFRAVVADVRPALRILRHGRFSAVVSTGAGVALSFLPAARFFGTRAHYIESATRVAGPSITGRILAAVPGVRTYAQSTAWESGRWRYRGSVLDEFVPGPARDVEAIRRVVVILGTNPYGFRALLERLVAILPPDADVLWQTGVTDTTGLPIDARPAVPGDEVAAAVARADVVVAHGGTGAALSTLEAGRLPLLVPRRPERGEQIDDHQRDIAEELERRGLAVVGDPDRLTLDDLLRAASGTTLRREAPAFELG